MDDEKKMCECGHEHAEGSACEAADCDCLEHVAVVEAA